MTQELVSHLLYNKIHFIILANYFIQICKEETT